MGLRGGRDLEVAGGTWESASMALHLFVCRCVGNLGVVHSLHGLMGALRIVGRSTHPTPPNPPTDIEALALALRNRSSYHHNGPTSTSSNNTKNHPFHLLHTTSPSFYRRPQFAASASGGLRPLSRLPLCQTRPQLAAAADALDRLMASAFYGLRVYPLLRLACLGYLLLLHIWAFGLLAFHSQRLEAVHADVGGSVAPGLVMGGGGTEAVNAGGGD